MLVVLPHLSVVDIFTLYSPAFAVFTLDLSIFGVRLLPSQSLATILNAVSFNTSPSVIVTLSAFNVGLVDFTVTFTVFSALAPFESFTAR